MKKGLFTGWQDIFAFTFRQGTQDKFRKTTLLVAIVLLAAGMAINIFIAMGQKKNDNKVSKIEKVYVVDDSGLATLDFSTFVFQEKDAFPKVKFDRKQASVEEAIKKVQEGSGRDVVLHMTHEKQSYRMELLIPSDSEIEEKEGEDLLNALGNSVEISKILSTGIPMDKLQIVMSGVEVACIDAGEQQKEIGEELVRMMLPMIIIMFLYFFVILYGMSMGNIVSVEKTSKLMEMLLTLTRPYSIILGKVLAMTTVALGQAFIWIASFVGGFFLGDYVAKQEIYDGYKNVVLEVFDLISKQEGSTGFGVAAIILFVITICISFLFYSLLAATFGSLASKPEELGQAMGYFQILVVLGFLGSYMVPMQEVAWMTTAVRLIPFTAAFLLPGDILVGNITVLQGALCVALLLVFTVLLVLLTGKVYKTQLFHRGESVLEMIKKKTGRRK